MYESEKWNGSRSVVSDSLRPHGLQPTRLLYSWGFPGKSTGVVCHCLLRWPTRQPIKKQRHYFTNKCPYSQSYGFSSSHVWMWELNHKEGWMPNAFELWCWRKLLRVPWTARRSKQSILKEINPKYPFEGQMLKLKIQYFGHLMQRTDSLEKTDAGKDWGQKEKDEIVVWHHWLNGQEFEQAPRVGNGQGSLACCSPWGCKESDTTEWLNNNVIAFYKCFIYPWNKVHQFPKLMVEGCYICCSNIFLTKIFDLLVYLLSRKVL